MEPRRGSTRPDAARRSQPQGASRAGARYLPGARARQQCMGAPARTSRGRATAALKPSRGRDEAVTRSSRARQTQHCCLRAPCRVAALPPLGACQSQTALFGELALQRPPQCDPLAKPRRPGSLLLCALHSQLFKPHVLVHMRTAATVASSAAIHSCSPPRSQPAADLPRPRLVQLPLPPARCRSSRRSAFCSRPRLTHTRRWIAIRGRGNHGRPLLERLVHSRRERSASPLHARGFASRPASPKESVVGQSTPAADVQRLQLCLDARTPDQA